MKKRFIATLLAYLLIICSIPTNVFAELKTKGGEYSYKEDFYAYTAIQYKDKTIISGYENEDEYEYEKSFIVDKNGKKTDLKHNYSFLSGDKALTTDSTPIELIFYQYADSEIISEYSYDFSTGKETEIYGDVDGYDKIKTKLKNYYGNDLSYISYIDDMGYEGNYVRYGIELKDKNGNWHYEDGLYKDGQVYRNGLSDLFESNIEGLWVRERVETKDGLFIFAEGDYDYDLGTQTNRAYYRDNSGNISVLVDNDKYRSLTMGYMNDNYIVIEGIVGYGSDKEHDQYIFKKNSKGKYDLVKTLSDGYRVQSSEDGNIYLLKGNRGELQELYQFTNNSLVKVNEFDEFYILNIHIYDHLNMALIGEYNENSMDRWVANIVKEAQGWVNTNGKWYYYNNGVMQKGWLKDGSKWYYLNSGGDMAIGWKQVGGKWYYLNTGGDMATGWKQVGGKWYYLNTGGDMATGWKQVGGKWYYLNTGGDMVTGWKQVGGKWYYLNTGGDMATGWKQVDGKWYYMHSSGVMATNTVIDGWRINSSGVATKIK